MGQINKQTFIFDVKTDKKTFDEWIVEHDAKIRADITDEFLNLLSLKGSFDIFESEFKISTYDLLMIEKQLKEQKE